VIELF